uniref:Uncharacterized protein n=1 Tax=Rhizophora mucronata TaxID=61149 RepID=A0A2P2PGS9_RHIMU
MTKTHSNKRTLLNLIGDERLVDQN